MSLGLSGKQFLESRVVLERPVRSRPIVCQFLFQSFDAAPLVFGRLIEGVERLFDALYGVGGIVAIDVGGVRSCAANELV